MGIDPGTTVGLAFLDLEGELLLLHSRKNLPLSGINRQISRLGTALIISTDVSPPPRLIEKASSSLSARLIFPRKSLSRLQKTSLVKTYCRKVLNAKSIRANRHEKDALASAIYAWKRVRPSLKKIQDKLRKRRIPAGRLEQFIKAQALLNQSSISRNLSELLKKDKPSRR